MISLNHSRALKTIFSTLQNTEVVWALTGSLGFALRGMELEVNDIDLQTDAPGAYGIENAFSGSIVRQVRLSMSEEIASHWGELEIEGGQGRNNGGATEERPGPYLGTPG